MADFGILSAVRQLLINEGQIKEDGIEENVHFSVPSCAQLPLVLLELEEIWTTMPLGQQAANTRVKLKASIFGKASNNRESMNLATNVRQTIEGKILDLKNGKKGVVKLSRNIVDMPQTHKSKSVQQYYEILVRG